ncbi:hypothetical protein HPB47_009171 [Ixodes persulcatus]|uniref:Uncharacterized protein n=1 Tax=Ixodes persulcatus TaxID=34615 RepID=A0AC60P2U7_IXOPE|nr:hypothetical protein HPB47_009171 [Ixodes persulcatus]
MGLPSTPGFKNLLRRTTSVKHEISPTHDLDCNRELLCLNASFKCGCPSETHFILSGGDGETALCVRGRKLYEPCVSHLECSLGDPNARCLNSFCSCASHFYVTSATVTCTSVRWYSASAVLLPILVLVPVVFVIGMVAYKRLHTDLGWRMLLLGVGKQRHKRFHNEKNCGDAAPVMATIPLDRYNTSRSRGLPLDDQTLTEEGPGPRAEVPRAECDIRF